MAVIGGDPLADFTILVTSNIDGAIAGLATLGASLEGLQATFAAMTAVGTALTVGLTLPIMALAAGAVLSENTMQGFYQTLQAGAVSSSISFDQLKDSFNQLYSQFPQGGSVIANTLLNVSNVMGSTFGGNQQDIQNFTAQILAASQITGQAADSMSKSVTQAFTQFKVSASDAIPEFNYLYSAAQLAREPVATLADELGQYGPTLSAFKLPMNDIIALLGNLNQSGLDVSKTVTGIGYAFATLEAGGKTVAPVIDAISKEEGGLSIQSMSATQILEGLFTGIQDGSITAAEASDIFGKRYAANIYSAISTGHLSFQQFEADAGGFTGSLTDMADKSATLSQKLDELKHDFEEALAPLGITIVDTLEGFMPVIVSILNYVKDLLTLFNELPQPIQDVVIIFAAVLAAIGPVLMIVGSLGSAFLVIAPLVFPLVAEFADIAISLGIVSDEVLVAGSGFLAMMGPVGWIILAVGALVALGVTLYTSWKPFHDLVDSIATTITNIPKSTSFTYSVTDTSQPKAVPKSAGGTGLTPPPGASVIPVNPPATAPSGAPAAPSAGSIFTAPQNQDIGADVSTALKPIASWFETSTAPQWYHDPQKGYYQSQGTPAGATSVNTPAEVGLAAHDIVSAGESIGSGISGGLNTAKIAILNFGGSISSGLNTAKIAILNFGGTISSGLGTAVKDIKQFGGEVVTFFQPLISGMKTAAGDIKQVAIDIGNVFFGMQEVICGVMIFIGYYVGQAWDKIVSIVGPPLNTMKNDILGGLNTIKMFFINTWNDIVNLLGPPLNTLKNDIINTWNTIVNTVGPPLNTLKNDIIATWNAITTAANTLKTDLENIWNGIVKDVTDWWNSVHKTATDGANTTKTDVESPFQTLVTDLQNFWNTIVNDAKTAWNDLCTWISNIKIPLPTMPDVKGWLESQPGGSLIVAGLHTAGIPGYAEGGIVTGPQLIMAGEAGPEAYVPLQGGNIPVTLSSTTTQAGSSPMAFNIRIDNATLTSTKDAQKLGLQIAYSAQRELSRSGYSRGT